jgi:hypothetical protein
VDDGGNDSGGRRERLMKNKNGKGADFFPILALDFLTLNAWNSSLFIGGGRETLFFFFYLGHILALDSTDKDLNRWFKGAIMICENWLLKTGRVSHFRVALRWQLADETYFGV